MTKRELIIDQLETIGVKETLFEVGYNDAKKKGNMHNMEIIAFELKTLANQRTLLEKELQESDAKDVRKAKRKK